MASKIAMLRLGVYMLNNSKTYATTIEDVTLPSITEANKISFTIYTSTEPLSKRYSLENGLIQKQAAAQMYAGTAKRVTMPFKKFCVLMQRATEKHAFGYGLHAENYPDKVNIVVSGKEQPDKNIIARTKAAEK